MKYQAFEIRGTRAVRVSRLKPYDLAFEDAEECARTMPGRRVELRSQDGELAVVFDLRPAHEEKPCSP